MYGCQTWLHRVHPLLPILVKFAPHWLAHIKGCWLSSWTVCHLGAQKKKRQAWPIQREFFCKHQCLKNISFWSPFPHSTPCTSVTIREQGKVGNTRPKFPGDLWTWTTSKVKRNLTFLWLGSYGKFIPNLNYLILEWIEEWKSFIRKRLPTQ